MVVLVWVWCCDVGQDDVVIVQCVLDWIGQCFVYIFDMLLFGCDGVDEFLFDYQVGFCEYFSGLFVVLMCNVGIFVWVVIGFVGGVCNCYGNYWVVWCMDVYVWIEVWLDGCGWVWVDLIVVVVFECVYDMLEDCLGVGVDGGL